MTSDSDEYISHIVVWNGVEIEVRYAARWGGLGYTSHLEVRSMKPERTPLPVTETGYKSHFTPCGTIEQAGGPVAFVTEWLNHEAKRPAWRAADAAARQGSLF